MLKSNSKTTIQDIAQQAGVSKATVSLVMNGSPKVSSKTCEKVRTIIQNLQYQPNEEARKLALRRWPGSVQATFGTVADSKLPISTAS